MVCVQELFAFKKMDDISEWFPRSIRGYSISFQSKRMKGCRWILRWSKKKIGLYWNSLHLRDGGVELFLRSLNMHLLHFPSWQIDEGIQVDFQVE